MKRLWLVACVLVLVAAPSGASGIGGGATYWDTSDASDDSGFGMKLVIDVGPRWNVDLRAGSFNGHGLIAGPRTISFDAWPIDLGLSYDFQTSGKVNPYVGAGFNYTLYSSDVFNFVRNLPETSRVKDETGWYGLIGVDIPIHNRIAVYLEAYYRLNEPTVQGDGVASFSEIPVDFSGAGATVGLVYTW